MGGSIEAGEGEECMNTISRREVGNRVIAWGLSIHYFKLTMSCSQSRSRFFFFGKSLFWWCGVGRIQV